VGCFDAGRNDMPEVSWACVGVVPVRLVAGRDEASFFGDDGKGDFVEGGELCGRC
jgi:hypothetical protein